MGARFAKWGLGFFVFGVFLTFGDISHYCVGASADVGGLFRCAQCGPGASVTIAGIGGTS